MIWELFYLYYDLEEENFSGTLLLRITDGKLSKIGDYNVEMVQQLSDICINCLNILDEHFLKCIRGTLILQNALPKRKTILQ